MVEASCSLLTQPIASMGDHMACVWRSLYVLSGSIHTTHKECLPGCAHWAWGHLSGGQTERRNYTHWENSVGAIRQRFKGLGDLEHDLEWETWALSKDILSQVTVNGQTRNRPRPSDAWKLGQGSFFSVSENDTFTPHFHFFYSELVSNQQRPWSHLYLPKLFFPTISLTVDLSLFSYPRQTLML